MMMSNSLKWKMNTKMCARDRVDLKAIMSVKWMAMITSAFFQIKYGFARSKIKIWRYSRTNGLLIYSIIKWILRIPKAFIINTFGLVYQKYIWLIRMILVLNWCLSLWQWRVDNFLTKHHPIIMAWFNMDIHLIWWIWRLAQNWLSFSNHTTMNYSSIRNGLRINNSLPKLVSTRIFWRKFYLWWILILNYIVLMAFTRSLQKFFQHWSITKSISNSIWTPVFLERSSLPLKINMEKTLSWTWCSRRATRNLSMEYQTLNQWAFTLIKIIK